MVKLIKKSSDKKSRKKKGLFQNVQLVFFLNDACNKLTWTNNIGVYTKDDISQIDLKLIELRSG